ncbi:MAG: LCP family protein [Bacilli bacterium]|nr:LCP family protein [Bacilli bacterium]
MAKKKNKRNGFQKFTTFFIVISVICVIAWGILYVVNVKVIGEEDTVDEFGNIVSASATPKKQVINALVCGVNENMTDTIIYIKYDVETGKIAMMSIPRDTSTVANPTMSSVYKINYMYTNNGINALIEKVEGLLDVNIDYYLVFDATMLKEMVDTIGGIEIDVPIRMKYDDGSQDLHIDLQPGKQVLNGSQAEGFVRFRHNNDMTVGYPLGDVQRTEVQQGFIKEFIKQVLSAKNISKIPDLIKIALKNTETNITLREATKYITDASKIDIEGIYSCTAPGDLKDVGDKASSWMSFYILDKKEASNIIKTKFPGSETKQTNTEGE